MAKNKKKRKNDSAHVARPPPSRPFSFSAPSDGRRHVSYQDLETNPTPPVPRHMVSYADSDEEGNDHVQHKAPDAPRVQGGDLTAAEYRERIMSRESDGTYDANRAQQRTDPTYGQVGAFPGLDKQPSEPFYGPANDGLAYLRMVRSEARAIPHVVTSTSRDAAAAAEDDDDACAEEDDLSYPYQGGQDDYPYPESEEGYYSDGAYVAKPAYIARPEPPPSPQALYHERLKNLYIQHRQRMQLPPSAPAVAALDDKHPISFPKGSYLAAKEWRTLLLTTNPLPAQLCSMDKWTTWRLIRLCERHIRLIAKHRENIPAPFAQWIWSVLGRLQESWQLHTDKISFLRDFARCAGWCIAHYRFTEGKESARERWAAEGGLDDYDDEDLDYGHGDDDGPLDFDDHSGRGAEEGKNTHPQTTGLPQVDGSADEPGAEDAAGTPKTQDLDIAAMLAAKRQQLQAEEQHTLQASAEQAPEKLLAAAAEEGHDPSPSHPTKQTLPEGAAEAAEDEEEDDENNVPNTQTLATLDMIITVVGEYYGQRDLLRFRQTWC